MLYKYGNNFPIVDRSVFVAPGAHIIGDVTIEEESSVWFNAVLRGDEAPIRIGKRTSIQDNSTCHLYEESPLQVGDEVTVGHNVILHGCTIENRTIIGMGSTILDGALIGEECIVGANSLVPPGKSFPPRSLILGSPAKVVRELTENDLELIQQSIDAYVQKGQQYKKQM
ncbi:MULTISPECIES: gamma carbonic anhydrase family protein [Pontibacillus]|uniref:Gamma carbonic anhydrase family protein n=1 Tax=Pontibacillus chungwhensis TaxID=265426 RepID=A0ABY8UT35_9BACI|nr:MULTISPECIES: gamma carbonic anhydrase family protein [Pontibacillus]MCD5323284.1 gamma carbonic anhydrase family protein [Pontibacillus sp. HN14]WIF96667.1 gamma carbonic anhydrase family protein [Pontibacillus chungwhensis]